MLTSSRYLDFPLHLDRRGGAALAGEAKHVRDLIAQLIFTAPGERVNRPEFGSGVLQLVFAPNSPELAATVQFTLQAALQRWLGDIIELRSVDVTAADAILTISLAYVIRRTGELHSAQFQEGA